MHLRITELRKIIRGVLIESYEADEEVYDDTVLPGDEADDELLAEPDLTDQKERDAYIDRKQGVKKKKDKLRSAEETEDAMGDENTIAGGGIAGHMGGAWGPPQKPKKLKPKNAMGGNKRTISKALDEYDE